MLTTTLIGVLLLAVPGNHRLDWSQFGSDGNYQPITTVAERIAERGFDQLTVFENTLSDEHRWSVVWETGAVEITRDGQSINALIDDANPDRISWTWADETGDHRGFLIAGPKRNTLVLQLGTSRILVALNRGVATAKQVARCACFGKGNPVGTCSDEECDQGKKCTPANQDRSCRWEAAQTSNSGNNQNHRP